MLQNRFITRLLLVVVVAPAGWAQQNVSTSPVPVSVCELLRDPNAHVGNIVRVRGWLSRNKEVGLLLDTEPRPGCPAELIAVVLPSAVRPRPDFEVIRDESFDTLLQALNRRTHIEGTFEGRLDSAVVVRDGKRVKVGKDFGHKGRATVRLVLRQVSDLEIRPTTSVDR